MGKLNEAANEAELVQRVEELKRGGLLTQTQFERAVAAAVGFGFSLECLALLLQSAERSWLIEGVPLLGAFLARVGDPKDGTALKPSNDAGPSGAPASA